MHGARSAILAGVCWIGAFLLYVLSYALPCLRPRAEEAGVNDGDSVDTICCVRYLCRAVFREDGPAYCGRWHMPRRFMQSPVQIPLLTGSARSLTPRQLRRAIAALVIGNGLEWFDFMAYAYFAKTIAEVFFPVGNDFISIALTFATFAVGFIVRPIGGIAMGAYADRYGRRRTLSLLIVLMAASTLLMGLIPGFRTVGVVAPLLVLLARVLQGLSAGGEFAIASTVLTQYAPTGRKMFYGSLQMTSQAISLLLSSSCAWLLTTHLSHESLVDWGWRVPFLLGGLAGPVGFYIRHSVARAPEFATREAYQGRSPRQPVRAFLRGHGDAALCAIGVVAIGSATTYLWHSYMPLFVERQLHLPLQNALLGTVLSGLVGIVGYPLAGRLADRFGAYRLFAIVTLGWVFAVYPLFAWVLAGPSPARVLIAQMIATVVLSLMSGAHPGMLCQLFPPASRSTGVALSYNVAVTLFGGLAPLTLSMLIDMTHSRLVPAGYLVAIGTGSLSLVCLSASGRRLLREPGTWPRDAM